ncbi:Crocetin glucosyltransferase, chloroplastic [Sesamum alatum]|uniref:Crocetin glucosyltransferase, chloroplastic n=1 Tax=Sesamum alatum TaxID=300844 RepID=A0AAE1XQK7_9LAMI|nr:Crocetin glucosyltransferase, chloroplastic [Sesamum alatum]
MTVIHAGGIASFSSLEIPELEQEAVKAFDNKLNVIAIGPLVPSAFYNAADSTDKPFGGDMFSKNEDYFQWLDSKPEKSVVYVCIREFGGSEEEEEEEMKKMLENELNNGDGIIVPWCSQTEVLSHNSIGLFRDALWMELDLGKFGVRARINEEVVMERGELRKCLDMVMGHGERGKDIRRKCSEMRGLAIEAVRDGGSTYNNLRKGVVVPLGVWHGESESQGHFIVGRILSPKPFHDEALRTVLQTAFNPVRGMDFKVLEDNRFLIRFNHILDCNRVLEHSPWAYEKCFVIVARVEENQNPYEIDLKWCEFHVLVQGLPLGKMTRLPLRIRVALDVRQSLRRLLKLRTVVGDEQVLYFHYERLPNFCYFCGCLGHISRFCELQFQDGFVNPGAATPFGPWLRAPPPSSARVRSSSQPSVLVHPPLVVSSLKNSAPGWIGRAFPLIVARLYLASLMSNQRKWSPLTLCWRLTTHPLPLLPTMTVCPRPHHGLHRANPCIPPQSSNQQ